MAKETKYDPMNDKKSIFKMEAKTLMTVLAPPEHPAWSRAVR